MIVKHIVEVRLHVVVIIIVQELVNLIICVIHIVLHKIYAIVI